MRSWQASGRSLKSLRESEERVEATAGRFRYSLTSRSEPLNLNQIDDIQYQESGWRGVNLETRRERKKVRWIVIRSARAIEGHVLAAVRQQMSMKQPVN
jgi:hypothetical protein